MLDFCDVKTIALFSRTCKYNYSIFNCHPKVQQAKEIFLSNALENKHKLIIDSFIQDEKKKPKKIRKSNYQSGI